jgi:iron complex outermembrane receptor protein
MAGVIHLLSFVPTPANTIRSTITSSYFTNNHMRSLSGNVSGNKNGINFGMYGSLKQAADYRNRYDGYVFNSKFNEHNYGAQLGYNGSWGYSHLLLSVFHLNTGMIEGTRNEDGGFIKDLPGGEVIQPTKSDFLSTTPTVPYQSVIHQKAILDNSFRIGKNRLTLNLGFQQNSRFEYGNPDDINEASLNFILKTLTYNAQFHLMENKGWKQTVGINGMQQQNTNKGLEQLIPDYRLLDAGLFYYAQKEIKNWNLSGGLRWDNRQVNANALMDGVNQKGTAFEKKFSNFSGSIGFTRPLFQNMLVKFNVARAFRAPSLAELASNGAHEGTIRYEYGDQTLKNETSTQLDAGLEFNSEHVSVNLSGFVNRFDNFIFYRKLQNKLGNDSIVIKDGKELTAFTFSQHQANMAGMEASIDFHPHPLDWLHIENTFSMVSGRFSQALDGSVNMPFMPAPRWITEIRAEVNAKDKKLYHYYAHLEIDNSFSQRRAFAGYNTETATAGYTLVNAEMGFDFQAGKQKFGIYLLANNIFDVAYQNHLSRLKYTDQNPITKRTGVFNMGRNFAIRVNVPLSWEWK